jgi:hypothetical protein
MKRLCDENYKHLFPAIFFLFSVFFELTYIYTNCCLFFEFTQTILLFGKLSLFMFVITSVFYLYNLYTKEGV